MATRTLMSVEEYAQMPRDEGVSYELVRGELIPVSSATPEHALIRDNLVVLLKSFLRQNPVGIVMAEVDCRTIEDTVRRPDLSFLTVQRWQQIDPKKIPVPGSPDIAVEILSPSEAAITVHRKIAEYLASGSREVWLLDVANQEIQVCGPAAILRLRAGDMLESALLPGFSAPVAEVLSPL